MDIFHTSLHHIDHSVNMIKPIDLSGGTDTLESYILKLLDTISSSSRKRLFNFKSDTTEVRTAINKIVNKKYDEGSNINANRLIEIEKTAQASIAHLGVEIQKGSLFQTYFKDGDGKKIIISKADHEEFLDEKDFLIHKGLPWKRRIFKAFLINFNEDLTTKDLYVFDTNPTMSKYWWHDYLELIKKHTDSHNTRKSLETIDKKIFGPIKRKHPADHSILRNSVVGYYRNKEEFEVNGLIDELFVNYQPVDDNLKIDSLIKKIYELPERFDFDTRFTIKKEEIKKRIRNKIKLTDSIDLVFKDHIENLENTISSEEDAEGNKFIKIRTDEGYERFKR